MKVSNQTKNVRRRFFRTMRRKLQGIFGASEISLEQVHLSMPDEYPVGMAEVLHASIFTPPASRKQGVKGKH